MPHMRVNGIEMYYEVRGSGAPLLMIMGWQGNVTWWPLKLLRQLEQHHTLIMFDNRGAGRSELAKGPYSIPLFAQDAVALMDGLGIHQAHVFGVSMGGMIAQELALRYPHRVHKLVLVSTGPGFWQGAKVSWETMRALGYYLKNPGISPDRFLGYLFYSKDPRHIGPSAKEFTAVKNAMPIAPVAMSKQLFAIARFNSVPRLKHIKSPTLVMTGTKDMMMPPKNSEILSKHIPYSRLVKIKGHGHAVLGQAADTVYHEVHRFLE